jgi:hypothetical protein
MGGELDCERFGWVVTALETAVGVGRDKRDRAAVRPRDDLGGECGGGIGEPSQSALLPGGYDRLDGVVVVDGCPGGRECDSPARTLVTAADGPGCRRAAALAERRPDPRQPGEAGVAELDAAEAADRASLREEQVEHASKIRRVLLRDRQERITLVRLFAAVCAAVPFAAFAGCGDSKQQVPIRGIAYTKFLRGNAQEIWIASPDGSNKRRLAAGRLPELSPDGHWVAFEGACDPNGGCEDLFVVRSAGGKPRRLARGVIQATWSPDSRRMLAYVPISEDSGHLVVLDRNGGRGVTVATGGLNGWDFSPNGRRVVFSKERRGHDNVFVVGVDGGSARRITDDGRSAFPVWTRNGILFSRIISGPGIPNHGWGANELWKMGADGRKRHSLSGPLPGRVLGQGISGLEPIGWSNEALLAGLVNEFGSPPYAVDPRTRTLRQIGRFGFRALADGLSRDGKRVLVETGNVELDRNQHVEVVPFSGGKGQVIARFAGEASWNL